MSYKHSLDEVLKKLGSIFFRVLIISYGIVMISIYENHFAFYYYIIGIVIYLFLFSQFMGKVGYQSILRLLIDFVFIVFTLYAKPLNLLTISFLLLPIFNNPNHSGAKRSYFFLFLFVFMSYSFLVQKVDLLSLIPLSWFLLISLVEYFRTRSLSFFYSLTSSVTQLYESKKRFESDEVIYNDILSRFNNSRAGSVFEINKIVYIKHKEDNDYYVWNSSPLVSVINIPDEKLSAFLDTVSKNEIFEFHDISFEEILVPKALVIPIKYSDKGFNFFILQVTYKKHLGNLIPPLRDKFYFTPCLMPFFRQLSVFFEVEHSFKKDRIQKFEKIKAEYDYVLRTMSAVHFIRNRLSPFKNFLEMSSDIRTDKNISEEIKPELNEIILSENQRSKITLNEILIRVNQILESSDNPFNVTSDIKKIKVKHVFLELRRLVAEILSGYKFESRLTSDDYEKEVSISKMGINVVFSDLVNNMNKHGVGNYMFLLEKTDATITISFSNEYLPSKESDLNDLVKYFESDENNNIFKMGTKGSFLLKNFLVQMSIKIYTEIDKKSRTFFVKLSLNLES